MERGIVGIVEIPCVVDRSTAKIDDIVALDLKIHVLKADLRSVLVSVIVKVADYAPFSKIVGAKQGQEISVTGVRGIVYARCDGIVFFRYFIVFDHEFGVVCRECHTTVIDERCSMILRIDGVNERGVVLAEAHDVEKLAVRIERERAFDGHGVHWEI